MKQNDWAERLETHLKTYRKEPKRDLWEGIEASLDKQAKQKARFVYLRRYMAAAALIGAIFGGAWLFWPQKQTELIGELTGIAPSGSSDTNQSETVPVDSEVPIEPALIAVNHIEKDAKSPDTELPDIKESEPEGTKGSGTTASPEPVQESQPIKEAEPAPKEGTKVPDPFVPSRSPRRLKMNLYASAGSGNYNNSNGVLMSPSMLKQFTGTRGSEGEAWLAGYEERQHHNQPVSFGLTVSYPFSNRFAITTGVVYTKLNSDFYSLMPHAQIHRHQTLHYVGVPLNIQFRFWQWRGLNAYLSVGGEADWNVKAEANTDGIDQSMRKDRMQWSVGGSLGLQYNIMPQLGLYVEPGVRHYLDNGSDVVNFFKDKPTSFNLQFGLRLNL